GYGVMAAGDDVLVGGIVKVEEKEEEENENGNITGMEQYLVCGIPVEEVVMDFFTSGLIFILVFFAVTILFLCYLVFEQKLRETDQAYEQKLKTYPVLFLVVMRVISLFRSRVNTVSTYLMNCAMRADDATSTMETYEKISDKIQKIFDQEYLIECRIAADILKKMPQYHTRSGMKEISTLLHVDNTSLFDKKGKTIVTDSLYDHFALSKDENSQSYAFRPLLEGVDYVVQEPMNDDSSGSYMQYVGVSIRDKNDLANGFAQIAISPQTMEKLQENINVSAKLNDINVGNDGLALVLDSDGVVTLSPRKTWVGKTAKELGILKKQRVDGFSGYVTINGTNYFAGANVTESGDVVFVVMPRKNAGGGQGKVILLLGAIAFMCMFMEAMVCRQPDTAVKEKKKKNKKGRFDKLWSGFRKQAEAGSPKRFFEKIDIPVNESMDTRWQNTHRKWADRTPEDKIFFILKAGLILFSAYIITGYVLRDKFLYQDSMFLYIIDGKWERGLNLFAVSAGLLIICVIYSFVQIINQLLYWIARVSDTKTETICHLMRSLLKYGSVIAVFYYCLALFGLDTRTLVASAGIMSVIVGLGAQKLIMDVIAGLFLVFENQYSVGDIVDVGGWSGRVVEIGIRSTKIASFENVKSFNNSEITGLINYMAKEVCTISSEISVSYEESLPRLIEIFGKELPALQDRISGAVDAPYFDGVTSIGDSGIVLVFRAHVKSDLKYPAERDYHRELLLLFERNHITVPYSHLSLDGRLQVEKKS
ncbi:MAG: mechanosensitive ion channel, partial [Lachnospiraceae bacterium]|nr:mechanosensitive ion channel [Lachnospiraceae bacterium]